ncbi:hypothetical protein [Alienimonas californiensis]|uniref:Uncharacterized protein n=1 Tax=Alienimonas californiensis TaxID=2527989 RepID=A0A517P4M3_9PLAN|nr:hypothetical protein [Alienimonas californiensis]QDT14296.1 hypothetical protein CA12_03680 [Alienimonas californiensis]
MPNLEPSVDRPSRFPFLTIFGAGLAVIVLFAGGAMATTGYDGAATMAVMTFVTQWAGQAIGTLIAAAGAVLLMVRAAKASGAGALAPIAAAALVTLAGLALRGDGWSTAGLGLVTAVIAWRKFVRPAVES